MSIQGDNLKAIADAIREVDGSTDPIVANDFPDRIRSISPGVKSFNGRTGDVEPAEGDYTAEQIGALPLTGGTLSGNILFPTGKGMASASLPISYIHIDESSVRLHSVSTASSQDNAALILSFSNGEVALFPSNINSSSTSPIVFRGIATPQSSFDAANKSYVDTHSFSIASNAGAHNSIFRGKNLGTSVTAAQYAAIAAGTFDDLFIGDYWVINGVNWRIAAFDYYLGTGGTALTTHHAVIVPDTNLDTQKMNDTDVTTGGYVGSKMHTANISTAISKIKGAFSGHVLRNKIYLSNAVSNEKVTGSTETAADAVLMSERNVYGQTIMSSECNDGSVGPGWYTYDRTQFPLFALAPEFIQKGRSVYWLRDVVSAPSFALVNAGGSSSWRGAGASCGVRPTFSIKG